MERTKERKKMEWLLQFLLFFSLGLKMCLSLFSDYMAHLPTYAKFLYQFTQIVPPFLSSFE